MSNQPMLMMQTTQPSGTEAFLFQMIPFLLVGLIIYWFMFRPQQLQVKAHRDAIAAVKKGDDVVTGGGIRGRVTKVTDEEAEVEIAQGVKVRVIKSTISQVLTKNAKPAND